MFKEVFLDAIVDSIKIVPFLFVTYLILEYLENRMEEKNIKTLEKGGKFSVLIGSILGAVPQCGFCIAASNFFAARVISIGTLLAIYLSTSDEMLPILISSNVSLVFILKIIFIKVLIGIIFGYMIDFALRKKQKERMNISSLCERENCNCLEEESIFKSALVHTLNITVFLFLITLLLNVVMNLVGINNLSNFIINKPYIGQFITGLIGLIPNCASSVIITKLYLSNIISFACMLSGLLVSAGGGLIVLFRVNKSLKENIKIVMLLYIIGVFVGLVFQILGNII